MTDHNPAPAAFAALTAIEAGEWDRFLLRLRAAIEQRRRTDAYKAHLIAGDDVSSHQHQVWMNGPGEPHWEIRGTGLIDDA